MSDKKVKSVSVTVEYEDGTYRHLETTGEPGGFKVDVHRRRFESLDFSPESCVLPLGGADLVFTILDVGQYRVTTEDAAHYVESRP